MKKNLLWIIFLLISIIGFSQNEKSLFNDITLQIDTLTYSKSNNSIFSNKDSAIIFSYTNEDEVCLVHLFPNASKHFSKITLLESGDYNIIDSIMNFNNKYWSFKVKFKHLTQSNFLKFRLRITTDSTFLSDINLIPATKTWVKINNLPDELLIGEERSFEITSNNLDNIKTTSEWLQNLDFSYRVLNKAGHYYVSIIPNLLGKKTGQLIIQTIKPNLIDNKPVYLLPAIPIAFTVKSAGLTFLRIDKPDITLDDKSKSSGIDIQIDNSRSLQTKKTYRIEDQENPGGSLIGEIYTRNILSNNKVLCFLRVYNYHRQADGYLYIKDGDDARYITNFNITPKTNITSLMIMRDGKDWSDNLTIYPGETFILKIEGESINKAIFSFSDLTEIVTDSSHKSETAVEFKLKVPYSISKKSIPILNNNLPIGKSLTIKEYQKASPFDYILIDYNKNLKKVTDFIGPELYDQTIKNVVITFQPDKIDKPTKLYGKQYIDIEIKIISNKGEILNVSNLENITICPTDNSPRFSYYDKSDCKSDAINLNDIIDLKTYDLPDWAKIQIKFKNTKDKNTDPQQPKTIEIIRQKNVKFDIDVSFPAGLLIKQFNQSGFGNLSDVSMAMIAQFSFYQKDKIAKIAPYKIGAGFLALNAFNFSASNSNRDIGAVIIGTIYPLKPDKKLSFPIYLGGGYLFNAKSWFTLIGPGISVQF